MDDLQKIEAILEEDVRPSLMEHEGDIELVSCEDGIVKIRLLGQCSGCPSARLTTEELIAVKIKDRMPQVKDVVLVQEISQDLLDFAHKILNHEIPA